MLLYFDVKDVLRKAKALQPSRIVLALGDASLLSVLSSRNEASFSECRHVLTSDLKFRCSS